jgi:hypothetical protein
MGEQMCRLVGTDGLEHGNEVLQLIELVRTALGRLSEFPAPRNVVADNVEAGPEFVHDSVLDAGVIGVAVDADHRRCRWVAVLVKG